MLRGFLFFLFFDLFVAVNEGLRQRKVTLTHETAQKAKTASRKAAVEVKSGVENKVSSDVAKVLEKMSLIGGVKIVVENFSEGDNSRGYYKDGEIHLNANKLTEEYTVVVAIHEAVHHISANNAEGYKVLKKYATRYLELEGKNVNSLLKEIKENRESQGEKLTPQELMEELVANTLSSIASDAKAMNAFLALNAKERITLRRVLENIAEKIKAFADKLTGAESAILLKNSDNLIHLAKELNKALKDAGENKDSKPQKSTANSGVKYLLKTIPTESEIKNNINNVVNMKPVAEMDGTEFSKGQDDLVTQVTTYFDLLGGYVETPYGKVVLNKKGVKSSIGHGIGRNKAIAFKAVPDVLVKGKVIDYQANWKQRGYDTVVVSAPVKIHEVEYYLAAVVIVEVDKNSYYLHEVVLQEKEDTSVFKTGTENNGTPSTKVSSIYTLLNKLNNVKKNSFPDISADITKSAENKFGVTYSWKETGYILTNGKKLDFSGKYNGAPGGYRTIDHREILEVYDDTAQNEMSGAEAMVDFMQRGNIRVSPETDGINISVLPTKAQEATLRDFISRVRGEVILDIDNEYGDTVLSVEYPRGTSSTKILQDIRQYFEDGTEPTVSEISKFRYSYADEEYLKAVNSGDMNTAQELVDKAADRKFRSSKVRDVDGKLLKVYHGTESERFNEFDEKRRGQTDSSLWGRGYYFSSDSEYAEAFGGNIRSFYLNITNPFTVSNVDAPASEIADKLIAMGEVINFDYSKLKAHKFVKSFGAQRFSYVLTSHGFDGVIAGDFEFVAFEREQMKLTDPVTYDNDGSVIPLTDRFHMSRADVRYSYGDESVDLWGFFCLHL